MKSVSTKGAGFVIYIGFVGKMGGLRGCGGRGAEGAKGGREREKGKIWKVIFYFWAFTENKKFCSLLSDKHLTAFQGWSDSTHSLD